MYHELLVIEDTAVHLSILRKIAAQAGFATTGVSSFEAAAQVVKALKFACITLDLNLGEKSGNDLLKLLSDMNYRGPLLIISAEDAHTRDVSARAGRILSLNVYPPFSKPVDLTALRQTLRQIAGEADRERRGHRRG
jgi:DNA-binding NtrC family response regulator